MNQDSKVLRETRRESDDASKLSRLAVRMMDIIDITKCNNMCGVKLRSKIIGNNHKSQP
jgi:hypothetical protein